MDFKQPIPIAELANTYKLEIVGSTSGMALGINEIHRVRKGDITFVDTEKYFAKALSSFASFILINKKIDAPKGKTLLICENPFTIYDAIIKSFRPFSPIISKPKLELHSSTIIEPNVSIGENVEIGKNCYIQSHVYIANDCKIGDNVIIQANCSIGTDAFYFKKDDDKYQKWTSGGSVIIENDVDLGPGCTINKGVSSPTIIGSGSKLDSQVHIGHGVIIGKNCLLAAQVGIAGKAILEDNVVLYGQVGVAQNVTIANGTVVLAKSGVSKNLDAGKVYFGYPAAEAKEKYRELATLRKLAKG